MAVTGIPSSGEAHHHFNLDLDFRLIECLDANSHDAGHRVPEQFTQRVTAFPNASLVAFTT
jgi:hypothetical protein